MANINNNLFPQWWEKMLKERGISPTKATAVYNKKQVEDKVELESSLQNIIGYESINDNTNVSLLPEGYVSSVHEKKTMKGPQGQTYLNSDTRSDYQRTEAKQWFDNTMAPDIIGETMRKPLRWLADPMEAGGDVLSMLGIDTGVGTGNDEIATKKMIYNPHINTAQRYGNLMTEGSSLSSSAILNWAPYEVFLPKATQKMLGMNWMDDVLDYSKNPYVSPKNAPIASSVDDASKGFKTEINWGNFNSEIPNNKKLMQEYNAIEQSTKANGTWMKNPDGSIFQGTPEQFVQQNSQNFKNAFGNSKLVNPDGSAINLYHGSDNKFNMFDESLFGKTDKGMSGTGIYTSPIKENATRVNNKYLYELYGQSKSPVYSSDLIKQKKYWTEYQEALFNFNRKDVNIPSQEKLLQYDSAIADELIDLPGKKDISNAYEIVFPANTQLKSAIGNNGMFDMTNPNIYKSLLPLTGIGIGLSQQNK